MTTKTYVDFTTPAVDAAWLNDVDRLLYDILGNPADDAAVVSGLGITATIAELNILDGVTSTAAELNILDGVTATATELNYVDGVTSAIQTQLEAKALLAGSASQAFARVNDFTLVAEQATTSGTSIDFTGIPSWATRITVMFDGVSTNGTSPLLLQIGPVAGVEASGYTSQGFYSSANTITNFGGGTTGFSLVNATASAADTWSGIMTFTLQKSSTNKWMVNATIHSTNVTGETTIFTGIKALAGTFSTIRITSAGGVNTFDAGVMSIAYE